MFASIEAGVYSQAGEQGCTGAHVPTKGSEHRQCLNVFTPSCQQVDRIAEETRAATWTPTLAIPSGIVGAVVVSSTIAIERGEMERQDALQHPTCRQQLAARIAESC